MTPNEFRAIRESLGMNKAQLARALGVRRATIFELEKGKYPITTPYALALKYIQVQHAGAMRK